MNKTQQLAAESVNVASKNKVRIYAQVFAYQRRKMPKMEMQTSEMGIVMPVKIDYDEFECPQLAVNINSLYIKESDLNRVLGELCEQIKKQMRDKGLISA